VEGGGWRVESGGWRVEGGDRRGTQNLIRSDETFIYTPPGTFFHQHTKHNLEKSLKDLLGEKGGTFLLKEYKKTKFTQLRIKFLPRKETEAEQTTNNK
jgi:hypothetical protein